MAQAGIHGLIGEAVCKWMPKAEWLMLGIVLGNLFPDTDNLAVAIATVAKLPTEGLHRTFTHSLFTIAAILAIFYIIASLTKKPRWNTLGIGLGVGVLMHILVDLLIWFNGVAILWPISSWVNLWAGYAPPEWFNKLMLSAEYLFLALYFFPLYFLAREYKINQDYQKAMLVWTIIQAILFVVFTVLVYTMAKGFTTINGVVYLFSLFLAIGVTIRVRRTVEVRQDNLPASLV